MISLYLYCKIIVWSVFNKVCMSKRIVLFGGVGSPTQYGGELSKNKEIIRGLEQIGYKLVVLDSFGSRKRKAKLLVQLWRLFCNVVFCPRSAFLFSTSLGNIYPIIIKFNQNITVIDLFIPIFCFFNIIFTFS